jgi:hypothetical protein
VNLSAAWEACAYAANAANAGTSSQLRVLIDDSVFMILLLTFETCD